MVIEVKREQKGVFVMLLASIALLVGLPLLLWSSERFITGASGVAFQLKVSPLVIGMFIVGFGTSAPEILVSVISALGGNPGIAIGNSYGSNITNIALVLGVTALLCPIVVKSEIVRKELPLLLICSALAAGLLLDMTLSQSDAFILLSVLLVVIGWTLWQSKQVVGDPLADDISQEQAEARSSLSVNFFWLLFGLILLVISSRIIVWGAVEVATWLNINEVIIGLTIVGIGTSLPELVSSVMAARKGENDLVIGNVVGSNLFNALAVTGLAGSITAIEVDKLFLQRDVTTAMLLTIVLLLFCLGRKGKTGRINRFEGGLLMSAFIAYTAVLASSVVG